MTHKGQDIKHPKLRGEWAELRFMARAAEHGLRVSKPWGDCARYDFAVETKGKFLRVQVKSTKSKQYNSYACNLRTTHDVPYTSQQTDFIAAYVIPVEVWYIIPIEVAVKSQSLILSPHLPGSKHDPYKEAWHLLSGKPAQRSSRSNPASAASADQNPPPPPANSEEAENEPDRPMSFAERRFRDIQSRLLAHPCWKPRP